MAICKVRDMETSKFKAFLAKLKESFEAYKVEMEYQAIEKPWPVILGHSAIAGVIGFVAAWLTFGL